MSIYNSEAFVSNVSNSTQIIGSITIQPGQSAKFWDTKNNNVSPVVSGNFTQIRNNHSIVYELLLDGYVEILHDGLHLNWEQSLSVLAEMYVQVENYSDLSRLLSTGVEINTVKEDDGRLIVTPSPIGVGWNIFFTGYDDDVEQFAIYKQNPFVSSGRGEGRPFLVEVAGEEVDPTIEEFVFVEPIHIHDGEINWGPDGYWGYRDRFSIGIRFSPSLVTVTPGTGNCNLINIITQEVMTSNDGYAIIIPAAGDGYFTVDLETACPIRNTNRNGNWCFDENTGEISVGVLGSSLFDLYNFAPADAWMMKNIATANYRHIMEPDVYRTELMHPSWKVIISVTKVTPGIGWLTGWFTCFRKNVQ